MVNGNNNISSKATEALVQHLVNSKAEKRMTTTLYKKSKATHLAPKPLKCSFCYNVFCSVLQKMTPMQLVHVAQHL